MAKKLLGIMVITLFVLGSGAAYAGVDPAALCKDKKGKETGKKTLGLLKAFGKNGKVPNTTKLTDDISKAQSKFTKGFTKAEFSGTGSPKGCGTTGDAAAIEAKVDGFVADVIDELVPPPSVLVELQGALGKTNGRFNYNLTLGLPGAAAACNSNFPGTHACELSELLIAEAAGDLVGLQDVNNISVTSFWAIDPGADVQTQCIDDVLGGSFLNWEYNTAHTGTAAQLVPLTNPTGVLGPVTSALCLGMSWVGCCL